MNIKLYYTPHTRAVRPRWLLEELQLPYSLQAIDLFDGEGQSEHYRRIHPHGFVPAMEIDGEIMIESGAMCHWLADRVPDKHLAPPLDSAQRRPYEQWMFYAPGTLEPPAFTLLLHSRILPEEHRVSAILPWAEEGYRAILRVLEQQLGNRQYLLRGDFSCADIMVGSTLMWLPELLASHPGLKAYVRRLQARPAWQRATVQKQED